MKRWSKEEIDFLRKNPSMPVPEVAKHVARSEDAIRLKFNNLKIKRCQLDSLKITDEERQFIIDNCNQLSSVELADRLGRTKGFVENYIANHKLRRKRVCNKLQFFDRPIDPQYAYVLGWIFADGCVNLHGVKLNIVLEDGIHIQQSMMSVFNWKIRVKKINDGVRKDQLEFYCHSVQVAKYLSNEWNLHKKTSGLSENFYNYIRSGGDECVRCFMRGFFEGDGTISKPSKNGIYVKITKHYNFDWTYIISLLPHGLKYKITQCREKKSSRSNLVFSGEAPSFLKFIYNTKFNTNLPRKKERAIAHFQKPYYRDKYGPLMEEV